MKLTTILLLFSLLIIDHVCYSQKGVSNWEVKNKIKSSFWGNSTYLSSSFTLAKNNEIEFSIGRTKGIITSARKGMGSYEASSWGFGLGIINAPVERKEIAKVFYEHCFLPFIIIGNYVVRGEYIYNIADKQSYLRPSIGLTILYFDILYNYSFLLNKNSNNFYKHGLTLRGKIFISKKNWEWHIHKREYQ